MSDEKTERRNRLTPWVVGGSVALAVAIAAAAFARSWPTQAVANALQLLGIALTALGVAVVRSWLQLAADRATDAKHGLERWAALRGDELRRRWARLRKRRPVVSTVSLNLEATQTTDAALELTVDRPGVDRDTVSERDWLVFLDNRVNSLFELMDQAAHNRAADRDDVNRRLAAQRNELRAVIQRETRQGWQLIVAGLAWSAVGTAVGIFG